MSGACERAIVRLFSLRSRLPPEEVSAGKTPLLNRGVGGLRTGGDGCLDVSGLCQRTLTVLFRRV